MSRLLFSNEMDSASGWDATIVQSGGTVAFQTGYMVATTPPWNGSGLKPKAHLSKRNFSLREGYSFSTIFDIYVPATTTQDHLILCDWENRDLVDLGQPGIRLRLNGTKLGIERSKFGYGLLAESAPNVLSADTWTTIEWRLTLAELGGGQSSVIVGDVVVIPPTTGATWLDSFNEYNNLQLGITVSSDTVNTAVLQFDKVRVEKSTGGWNSAKAAARARSRIMGKP